MSMTANLKSLTEMLAAVLLPIAKKHKGTVERYDAEREPADGPLVVYIADPRVKYSEIDGGTGKFVEFTARVICEAPMIDDDAERAPLLASDVEDAITATVLSAASDVWAVDFVRCNECGEVDSPARVELLFFVKCHK